MSSNSNQVQSQGSSDSHLRRSVICVVEDRISKLPEEVIDSIFEYLPVQDVVRTSILSKKWRYRWTTMRAVVLDKQFFKRFGKNGAFGQNGFVRIINHVLFFHKGPILKFVLHIPKVFLDNFQEVNQWMLFLSRNGVHTLNLVNSNQRYQLPSYVFSCLELRILTLQNFVFKPPYDLQGFLYLNELNLKNIDFGPSLCENLINIPQLVDLSLNTCTNVNNFKIKARRLRSLCVFYCPDVMLLQLLQSECLTTVVILFRQPAEGFVQVERTNLAEILSHLPNIKQFILSGYYLKFFIAEKPPKWLPQPLNLLTILWLEDINIGDLGQLHGALCLLRNSPNLIDLYMSCLEMGPHIDVEPSSSYLDAPDSLDQTLNNLRTVQITCVEGSRPEVLFIKLVLAHSPSLEQMIIGSTKGLDADKRLNIAKDVMRFPRASVKAEMFYLDMNP